MDRDLVSETSVLRAVALFLLSAALAACVPTAGRDFVDNRASLVLGQTTISQAESAYGQPFQDRKNTTTAANQNAELIAKLSPFSAFPVSGEVESIDYFYRRGANYKSTSLNFVNGTLVEYTMGANFPSLSTDFDDGKTPLLVKGKTTKAEALALFGTPSGEAIYPAVRDKGNTKLRYFYQPPTGPTIGSKRLEEIFDSAGVLVDYQFQSSTGAAPTPVMSTPTIIPIPIVTPHK